MSAVLSLPAGTSAWRAAGWRLGVLVAAILLLYRETLVSMVGIWSRSDTFAHAFLVPPIFAWLIWRQREHLALLTPRPWPWVTGLLALSAAGWLIGELASVNAAEQLMFVVMLVLTVPVTLGWTVTRALSFPLAFLFFMVPIGEFLMPALMEGTADFTVLALRASGVPVYREGLKFVIPTGNWSVVEACSGVRYLIASFMVGTLFGYLNYQSPKRRWIFAGVAILMPILANWVRAYMIVMLGHLSNNRIAAGVDHLIYGWIFFGVVILLMFFVGARWSEPDAPRPAPGTRPVGGTTPAPGGRAWALTAMALAAIVWPLMLTGTGDASSPVRFTLPAALSGGEPGTTPLDTDYKPRFVGAPAEAHRLYMQDGRTFGVYVAYYRAQGPGRKLVSSENVLVLANDHHWNELATTHRDVKAADRTVAMRSTEVLDSTFANAVRRRRLELRQMYWVDGRFTDKPQMASLLSVVGRLAGRGDDGASVIVYTDGESAEETGQALDRFIAQHLGEIESALAATRAAR